VLRGAFDEMRRLLASAIDRCRDAVSLIEGAVGTVVMPECVPAMAPASAGRRVVVTVPWEDCVRACALVFVGLPYTVYVWEARLRVPLPRFPGPDEVCAGYADELEREGVESVEFLISSTHRIVYAGVRVPGFEEPAKLMVRWYGGEFAVDVPHHAPRYTYTEYLRTGSEDEVRRLARELEERGAMFLLRGDRLYRVLRLVAGPPARACLEELRRRVEQGDPRPLARTVLFALVAP